MSVETAHKLKHPVKSKLKQVCGVILTSQLYVQKVFLVFNLLHIHFSAICLFSFTFVTHLEFVEM